jgi:hypothetical protein
MKRSRPNRPDAPEVDMQHVDEGTIHAWLDGALAPDESRHIEAHVTACGTCSAAVAEARGLIAAASRILTSLDDVPAGVIPGRERVATGADQLAALRARHAASRTVRRPWWRQPRFAAAAGLLIVAAGTARVMTSGGRMPAESVAFDAVSRAAVADSPSPSPSAAPAPLPGAPPRTQPGNAANELAGGARSDGRSPVERKSAPPAAASGARREGRDETVLSRRTGVADSGSRLAVETRQAAPAPPPAEPLRGLPANRVAQTQRSVPAQTQVPPPQQAGQQQAGQQQGGQQQAGKQQAFRPADASPRQELGRALPTGAVAGAARAMTPAMTGPAVYLLSGCYQITGQGDAPALVPARWQLDTARAVVRGDTTWHRAAALGPSRERDDEASELRWRPIDQSQIELVARRGAETVTLRIMVADAVQSADRARRELGEPATALRAARIGCP